MNLGQHLQKPELPPPPPPDDSASCIDECRLWIGNISTRLTEFAMLKLLQTFGHLKKFDFLYHRTGPDQGKPRGYCFVTYSNREEAEHASRQLNGKLALDRRLVVKYAHVDQREEMLMKKRPRPELKVEVTTRPVQPTSNASQIQAIEAKLRMMEQSKDDVSSFIPSSANSTTQQSGTAGGRQRPSASNTHQHHKKPYQKHKNTR